VEGCGAEIQLDYARFEVLAEVLLKIQVIWSVKICHWD
jgi:hypothetical protein